MRQGLVVRPCSVLLKATATSSARRQDGKRRSVLPRSNTSSARRQDGKRRSVLPKKQHHPPGGKTAKEHESNESARAREKHSASTVVWAQGSPRFRVPVQGLVRSDRTNKPCYPVQRRMLKMAREGGVQSNFCQGYISKILTVPLGLHLQLATTL